MAIYKYKIENFENGYEPVQLCREVTNNISKKNVLNINVNTETGFLIITFDDGLSLSCEEKRTLDTIISNHIPTDDDNIKKNEVDLVDDKCSNINDTTGMNNFSEQYIDKYVAQIKQEILSSNNTVKNNFNATIIPSKLDDIISGYSIGSLWLNKITNKCYICINNTEIKADWSEITSQGEFSQIKNIGTGEGIYSNKIDSTHYLKSIKASDNISLVSDKDTVLIKGKDTHSYLLSSIEVEVINTNYQDILCFPWLNSEFNAYKNGKLIFEVVSSSSNPLSIRIKNITENSVLGELINISSSTFYELKIANPSENARIKIQVKKANYENDINPKIYGVILKYET